jgi:hypothetical protein
MPLLAFSHIPIPFAALYLTALPTWLVLFTEFLPIADGLVDRSLRLAVCFYPRVGASANQLTAAHDVRSMASHPQRPTKQRATGSGQKTRC